MAFQWVRTSKLVPTSFFQKFHREISKLTFCLHRGLSQSKWSFSIWTNFQCKNSPRLIIRWGVAIFMHVETRYNIHFSKIDPGIFKSEYLLRGKTERKFNFDFSTSSNPNSSSNFTFPGHWRSHLTTRQQRTAVFRSLGPRGGGSALSFRLKWRFCLPSYGSQSVKTEFFDFNKHPMQKLTQTVHHMWDCNGYAHQNSFQPHFFKNFTEKFRN